MDAIWSILVMPKECNGINRQGINLIFTEIHVFYMQYQYRSDLPDINFLSIDISLAEVWMAVYIIYHRPSVILYHILICHIRNIQHSVNKILTWVLKCFYIYESFDAILPFRWYFSKQPLRYFCMLIAQVNINASIYSSLWCVQYKFDVLDKITCHKLGFSCTRKKIMLKQHRSSNLVSNWLDKLKAKSKNPFKLTKRLIWIFLINSQAPRGITCNI